MYIKCQNNIDSFHLQIDLLNRDVDDDGNNGGAPVAQGPGTLQLPPPTFQHPAPPVQPPTGVAAGAFALQPPSNSASDRLIFLLN